jgi:hypothetical protein
MSFKGIRTPISLSVSLILSPLSSLSLSLSVSPSWLPSSTMMFLPCHRPKGNKAKQPSAETSEAMSQINLSSFSDVCLGYFVTETESSDTSSSFKHAPFYLSDTSQVSLAEDKRSHFKIRN